MIDTPRLTLRLMTSDDIDDLLVIFADPRVMASFGVPPFDRARMERWVNGNLAHQEEHGYGNFAVVHKLDQLLIGDCGLEHMEVDGRNEVEIGYDLRSDYWGRGLATEAATAVREFAFRHLGLDRVISLIRPENGASRRVAEKVGMTLESEILRGDSKYEIWAASREQSPAAS
jgi:RimJ/RimL family protein N-acetyltransferase